MTIRNQDQHELRLIKFGLLRSDPLLVALMNVFSGLTAGQDMPSWERMPTRVDRVREAAALIMKALVTAFTTALLMLRGLAATVTSVVIRPSARSAAFHEVCTRGREGA